MLNSILKRVLMVLCATIVMVAFQNCSEAQRPVAASDAQHKISDQSQSAGQTQSTVAAQKSRSAVSAQRSTGVKAQRTVAARTPTRSGKKIMRINFSDSNEPTQVRKQKRMPAGLNALAIDNASGSSVCNLSNEELQDLIMKANIRAAYLDRTPVKVLTGAQSLLQLADGEIGIITTRDVDAEVLRLELGDGNELMNTASSESYGLTEGQDAVLKIQLVKSSDSVVSFQGLKSYIVRFTLDAKSSTEQIGERCVLKPRLVMTEALEVQ